MSMYLDIYCVGLNYQIPEVKVPLSSIYELFSGEEKVLKARSRDFYNLGIIINPPEGTYCQILPRNTMTSIGIDIAVSLITHEDFYQGETKVLLINNRDHDIPIFIGDRIAQLLLVKMEQPIIRTNLPA